VAFRQRWSHIACFVARPSQTPVIFYAVTLATANWPRRPPARGHFFYEAPCRIFAGSNPELACVNKVCVASEGSYSLRTFREDCATIPRLSFETKKYLSRKPPSRPRSGPPQLRQVISRSVVGPGGASIRTTLYSAPQLGQFASSAGEVSDMAHRLRSECRKEAPKRRITDVFR
jgi:hypothetical protein